MGKLGWVLFPVALVVKGSKVAKANKFAKANKADRAALICCFKLQPGWCCGRLWWASGELACELDGSLIMLLWTADMALDKAQDLAVVQSVQPGEAKSKIQGSALLIWLFFNRIFMIVMYF